MRANDRFIPNERESLNSHLRFARVLKKQGASLFPLRDLITTVGRYFQNFTVNNRPFCNKCSHGIKSTMLEGKLIIINALGNPFYSAQLFSLFLASRALARKTKGSGYMGFLN